MNRHVAFDDLVNALRCGQSACPCAHNGSGTYTVHCPAHDDTNPSLSVTDKDGTVLFYCHANCTQDAVIAALRTRNLWPTPEMRDSSVNGEKVEASSPGVTVEALADLKNLPVEYLLELGLSNFKHNGIPTVRIPYRDQDGNEIAVRFRHALEGKRFSWRKGDHVALYGLDRLNQIRAAGWVLLVEGESDCWTLWMYGLPALGIPGKSTWRELWARWLDGLAVFVWEEPAAEDLVKKIAVDIPDVRVIQAPDGVKDPSDAHLLGHDLPSYIDRLKASSVPAHAIVRSQTDARTVELERQAATVLTATEPLKLIVKAIRAVGYGGKIKPALIVYLAVTSRLLYLREGGMLVHLLLLSSASAGKSWTVKVILRLLPHEAYHIIDAGSPHLLIYDNSDLRHRVVIFAEADSLPAGEDSSSASAVRNLLADGYLHYGVVVRDETGQFVTREIRKDGPTTLITTAVQSLGHQMMTRLFTLELSENPEQIRSALKAQARMEVYGAAEPDNALLAFQSYLQARAPWNVHIPFAEKLAEEIGKSATAPRILRDYNRVLSLIKSVAVLRHKHRQVDSRGRIVAELADYSVVRGLLDDMYADTSSGATKAVREVVDKVSKLLDLKRPDEKVTPTKVADALGIDRTTAWRRINAAIRAGWLANNETRKGHPADLALGEPLPPRGGLPDPKVLKPQSDFTIAGSTDGSAPPSQYPSPEAKRGPVGGGDHPTVGGENVKTPPTGTESADDDDFWNGEL